MKRAEILSRITTPITKEISTIISKIAENGIYLACVPIVKRTSELCLAAVQNGLALDMAPAKLRTEELCQLAVAQNANAIEFVPTKLKRLLDGN